MNIYGGKFRILVIVVLVVAVVLIGFSGHIGDFIEEKIFISKYSEKKDFRLVYSVIKENKEFIGKNSLNDSAYNSLGQGYYVLQAYNEAIGAFKRATEISPENIDHWSFLAKSYMAKKDYPKARDAYIEILRLDPDRPDNYTRLAWLYYFRIDVEKDKAFDVLRRGLEKFPNDKDILFDITRFYLYDENKNEFLKYASRYLKIDPDYELIKKRYEEWK